jgi:MinD-like ATPase involved in chromosome partitioning or flagellar assembly
MMISKPKIIAFYSYKGGVGRSLALANTAVALAKLGHRVLTIDLDLEAPGLHEIKPFRDVGTLAPMGLLELLGQYKTAADNNRSSFPNWVMGDYIAEVWTPSLATNKAGGSVWLMASSGSVRDAQAYSAALSGFKWGDFYAVAGDTAWANIADRLVKKPGSQAGSQGFDYVLIDSRTGLSDPFYIVMTLASELVLMTGFNRQNIKGIRNAYEQTQNEDFVAEFGKKTLYLVGSPAPDFEESRWKQWSAELDAFNLWPRFPGLNVRLPYVKEFALDERVVVDEVNDHSPVGLSVYADSISKLAGILSIDGEVQTHAPQSTPEPTNPFDLIRADYANVEELGRYFIDPGQELLRAMKTFKPVVMQGARGSGKTMLGRHFSFEREATELKQKGIAATPSSAPEFLGLYMRIDIDLLQIFNPPTDELKPVYNALFGQFFDLLVFRSALDALEAFGGITQWCGGSQAETKLFKTLMREFGSQRQQVEFTLSAMRDLLKETLAIMREFVNNPTTVTRPFQLQSNILLKLLVEELTSQPGAELVKHVFAVIVDEYEHFSEAQQRVVNSRIKQIKRSDNVTYRIFVKHGKAGLHTTATLADKQQIQPIHDFNLINLDENIEVTEFAKQQLLLAERHLQLNPFFKGIGITTLTQLLATENSEGQAQRIVGTNGDKLLRREVTRLHGTAGAATVLLWFDEEPRLLTKAVAVVIMNQGLRAGRTQAANAKLNPADKAKAPDRVVRNFRAKTQKATDWLHNYERGTLFWLARLYGKPQSMVYAGSDMVITLAGRNVRTFLELCRAIVEEWFAKRKEGDELKPPISVIVQTDALRNAAEAYRGVIRSLPLHSKQLLDFTDHLGRLFEVLAKSPTQSEPEINHFSLAGDPGNESWNEFFQTAYAESILLRFKGNKQKSDADLQSDDWQLNPCFAPHYGFSPRRKKKLGTLSSADINTLFVGSRDDYQKLQERFKKKVEEATPSNQESLFGKDKEE